MTNEELAVCVKNGVDTVQNMERLYLQTKGFIYKMAKRYSGYAELEDLVQEGYFALHDAARHYDGKAGASFLHYFSYWLKSRMLRYAGEGRTPVLSLSDIQTEVPDGTCMEEEATRQLDHERMSGILWNCVEDLGEEQSRILHLVYEHGMNRNEAAKEIGATGNRVRREERKALHTLRYGGSADKLRPYYREYLEARAYGRGTEWNSVTERVALELTNI